MHVENKRSNKFYILSTPASGKTTFIKQYGHLYRPFEIYDFDWLKPYRDYRALDQLPDKSVVLGGLSGKGLKFDPEKCAYLSVILPESQLLKLISARRRDCSWGVWPFRFRKKNQEGTGWDSKERILQSYADLIEVTERHGIPSFSSFVEALEYILNNYGT